MTISTLRALVISLVPLMAAPAFAQASQPTGGAQPAAAAGGLEEIIITARKREESLQDAPIQVTAISKERIEQFDVTSLEKIAAMTPQLFVGRLSNGSGAQITMRGIGSSATSIGLEQSVAVILDGVYFGQGRVLNEGMFDLAQVEVLKGPQALFFGKNATAGVISLTTAKPTQEFEVTARGYYEFEGKELRGEGIVSGPLTDTIGARFALRYAKMYGGLFDNTSGPQSWNTFDVATATPGLDTAPAGTDDTPGNEDLLGRLTFSFDPTDDFSATFSASYTSSEFDNSSFNAVIYNCPGGVSQMTGLPCRDHFKISQNRFPQATRSLPHAKDDGSLYNQYESYSLTANIEYTLGAFQLTSVTNWQDNQDTWACHCDGQSQPGAVYATEISSWRAVSEEVRLLSDFDFPVNFMAGLLFQDTARDFKQWFGFLGLLNSAAPKPSYVAVSVSKDGFTDGQTVSPFAQLLVDVTDAIELSAGVRYTHETKDSRFIHPYLNPGVAALWQQGVPVTGDQEFNDWSPEATISWHVSDDLTLYGAYKTAYKSGGFSISGLYSAAGTADDFLFDPETVEGGEIGVKSTLMDGQMRLNGTAYWYTFDDLQVDFFNSPSFAFITLNAGKARTRGFEIESEYAPRWFSGLILRTSAAFNDAEYQDFIAPCWAGQTLAQGCNQIVPETVATPGQDISGMPTTIAPEWSASYGIEYEGEVAGFNWGAALDGVYSGDYLASTIASPHSARDSFATLNLSAHIGTGDGRWDLALIAKNLTDQLIISGGGDAPSTPLPGNPFADQFGLASNPRTIAMQLTYKY
jgi:iron complex outermembrane receptor protein